MILGIKAQQDQGKTSLAVKTILHLLCYHGYQPHEVISNVKINIDGTNFVSSETLILYMSEMIRRESRHKILLLDEVDRIFPHRFWNDKQQTRALLGLWQDVKMFHWVIWTAHLGAAVDLLLRQCTQTEVIPAYNKQTDITTAAIIDCVNLVSCLADFYNISAVFPLYDRWATVSVKTDRLLALV